MANKRKLKSRLSAKKTDKKTAKKRGPARVVSASKRAQEIELQNIEQLLGEDFESIAQARRALKKELSAKKTDKKTDKKRGPARVVSASKRAQEIELQNIEQLLGEDFESIAQARRALKKETDAQIKRAPKKQPERLETDFKLPPTPPAPKSYTLKELNPKQHKAVAEFLKDRSIAKRLDKEHLAPGEYWAAEIPYKYKDKDGTIKIGYAKTYNVYQGIAALFAKLSEYAQRGYKKGISVRSTARWLNTIRIVQFGGGGNVSQRWGKIKQDEVRERKKK